MPGILTSFDPGIAAAVASPPDTCDQRVVLAVDHQGRRTPMLQIAWLRSPDAAIAASWRRKPAG